VKRFDDTIVFIKNLINIYILANLLINTKLCWSYNDDCL